MNDDRRRFLQLMGLALAAPTIPAALRQDAFALIGRAEAAEHLPTYFIEINLRDQWDHGHLFVAPGLATNVNLKRGEYGRRAAMFYDQSQLKKCANDVYLTPESLALEPHLDHVALIETCELSRGAIHGHEAASPMRSPGRDYNPRSGALAMFKNDPVDNFPQGCEAFYGTVPTPATLHNFVWKADGVHNGIAFKGISRSIHTAYHFAAALPGAELDRYQSQESLLRAFGKPVASTGIIPTRNEAEAFARILQRVDKRFLQKRGTAQHAIDSHDANIKEAQAILSAVNTRSVSLPLTPEESAFWSDGVPDQVTTNPVKAQIWEQVAYAFKLVSSGVARTVALEFDYVDVHDQRTEDQMRVMTLQVALPLSRLIQKLKDAGIFERTLVALYTTDGGRSPAAASSGNEGKNSVLLAGGMIRGGYFGDVRVAGDESDGHLYSFHAPDPVTGAPGPGYTNNDGRLAGSRVWRTVAKAMGVPDGVANQFSDVSNVSPLPFLLR